MIHLNRWLFIRLILLAYFVYVGWHGAMGSEVTWPAALLIPIVFGVFGFLWLRISKNLERIVWSDAFSLTKPFFPFTRHPMEGIGFLSLTLFVLGAVSGISDVVSYHRIESEDVMNILMGVSGFLLVRLAPRNR